MAKPLSLGDSTLKLKPLREEYPLPDNRKGVLAAIESILGRGGVQRLLLELGNPIRVTRMVRPDEAPDVQELPDDNLLVAARNAPMEEFVLSEKHTPFEYFFKAFYRLTQKRLTARAFVVNNIPTLKKWLQLDEMFDLQELFGVEVIEDTDMPSDALLLVAIRPQESSAWLEVAMSLRLAMNLPTEKKGKT